MQTKKDNDALTILIDPLLESLYICDHVCEQVNQHSSQTANQDKQYKFAEWNMEMKHLVDAQRAICRAAITLERDILQAQNRVEVIPIPQYCIMQDLRLWVPEETIQKLFSVLARAS
jgi:hypothetical protein